MLISAKMIKFLIVLALGVLVQLALIPLDNDNVPRKVALEFTKAYHALDTSAMAENLCGELKDENAIEQYIQYKKEESEKTGFDLYKKSVVYHMKTDVSRISDSEAQVKVSGKKRYSINPIYTVVAVVFRLGEVHHFDETLYLITEDAQWKVCGDPFSLTR